MSKTLRRPMFRGGRVSSYGTGIASGLADGGRVGYFNGELVTGGNLMNMTREQALRLAELYGPTSVERFPGETEAYKDLTKEDLDLLPGVGDQEGYNWFSNWYKRQKPEYKTFKSYATETDEVPIDPKTSREREVVPPGEIGDTVTGQGYIAPSDEGTGAAGDDTGVVGDDTTISIGDSEADIQEMSDRYFKLLGGDKARGQDISDMLLRFAGSKGDTTIEKFQEFTAKEADIPSRTEKIKQTAGMLGIKGEQTKEAARYAMEKGLALKLAGLTDVKKDRAKTTRLADYTKQFLDDLQNPFKQRNAGTFAAATVLSEDIADGTGEFISVLGYDADGNASATAGVIYIDPVGMTKGTPFFLDNNHYSKLEDAKKAKGV